MFMIICAVLATLTAIRVSSALCEAPPPQECRSLSNRLFEPIHLLLGSLGSSLFQLNVSWQNHAFL